MGNETYDHPCTIRQRKRDRHNPTQGVWHFSVELNKSQTSHVLKETKNPWLNICIPNQRSLPQLQLQPNAQAPAGLTLTVRTPPLPDVDRLRGSCRAPHVVMHTILVHSDICHSVEHHEGEVSQVNLMDLIEHHLPCCRIRRCFLCYVQLVQRWVAVEGDIEPRRRELAAGEECGVIRVVAPDFLELADIEPSRHCSRWRRRVATG